MPLASEKLQEFTPHGITLSRICESVRVSNHDQRITCPRKQYIETLRRRHKADVVVRIASAQRSDDNIAFFTLVVV